MSGYSLSLAYCMYNSVNVQCHHLFFFSLLSVVNSVVFIAFVKMMSNDVLDSPLSNFIFSGAKQILSEVYLTCRNKNIGSLTCFRFLGCLEKHFDHLFLAKFDLTILTDSVIFTLVLLPRRKKNINICASQMINPFKCKLLNRYKLNLVNSWFRDYF